MKILLIGPQGSGKSTQGKLLSQHLGIPYISTGDIFRQKAQQNTDEGKKIKQILDSGQLVDDETTGQLVKERLENPDVQNGYILDGYPRTSEQVSLFDVIDSSPDYILYLKIPDNMAIERLMKRGRADDTEEIIKNRLDLYKLKTEALLSFLKGYGKLKEISGEGEVEEVQNRIKEALNG